MLDTSAYSAFGRGDERLKAFFDPQKQLLLPIIVVGELRGGFAAGAHQRSNERLLQRFIDSPIVKMSIIKESTTHMYAHIYSLLRKSGKPMGTNDIWIAALALEHDAVLVTLDSDFTRVPDLMIAKL